MLTHMSIYSVIYTAIYLFLSSKKVFLSINLHNEIFTESCRNGDLWGSWTNCYPWIWTNGSGTSIIELLCSESYHFCHAVDILYCVLISYPQVLANFLSTPLASGLDTDMVGWPYVAFDLNPSVVKVRKSFTLVSFFQSKLHDTKTICCSFLLDLRDLPRF